MLIIKLAIALLLLLVVDAGARLLKRALDAREARRGGNAAVDAEAALGAHYIEMFEAEREKRMAVAQEALKGLCERYREGQLTREAYENACRFHRLKYGDAGEQLAMAAICEGLDPLVAQVIKRKHYDCVVM